MWVTDAIVFTSVDRSEWNIQFPEASLNDVRWRLRKCKLSVADSYANGADDMTALRFRIAAYGQSHADDAADFEPWLRKLRIGATVYRPPAVRDLVSDLEIGALEEF